jgi:hypothetical protein
VLVVATLIDSSTGAAQTVVIGAATGETENGGAVLNVTVPVTDEFQGPVPSNTLAC